MGEMRNSTLGKRCVRDGNDGERSSERRPVEETQWSLYVTDRRVHWRM
jgi:hypothetical protein